MNTYLPTCADCQPGVAGKVHLCPLHAAAPALLAALDDLLHAISTMGTCPTPDDDHCLHAEAIRRANAAIAAAKGDA